MAILQGPVICRTAVSAGEARRCAPFSNITVKAKLTGGTTFRGGKRRLGAGFLSCKQPRKANLAIRCSFRSSSDGSGSMAGNFNESDEEYVNCVVTEAVELRNAADGFFIKMRNGQHLRCVLNNPFGGRLPDYDPHPAVVLKTDDGSNLLFHMSVTNFSSEQLMIALHNVQLGRPTVYQVVNEMIEKMGYKVLLVRVTSRVQLSYFARIFLCKVGNEEEKISFEILPSDAINIAVRCKVPIQVHKQLALAYGMRVVEPSFQSASPGCTNGYSTTEMDRPTTQPCLETIEFYLVRNMLIAVVEERYSDAARWRDSLRQFRSRKNRA